MIFVFGSNEKGIHGGGAARYARDNHGAVMGQGFGPMGNSFGIPTCSKPTSEPGFEIPYQKLSYYIECFIAYARRNPNETFQVTKVGCGLAGWRDDMVAPLFSNAPANCQFDTDWKPWLHNKIYWGHI